MKLFTYEEWDELDDGIIVYSDCTLLEDFGTFNKGTTFEQIVIDLFKCTIKFDEEEFEFDIRLRD